MMKKNISEITQDCVLSDYEAASITGGHWAGRAYKIIRNALRDGAIYSVFEKITDSFTLDIEPSPTGFGAC
jgi:hypothetical protein